MFIVSKLQIYKKVLNNLILFAYIYGVMAIKLSVKKTSSSLFCCSKWWGNPDLPPQMEYPVMKYENEEGEQEEYPLTFVCQIDCADIAPYDAEGKLPHEGMLYFFAAIDDYVGYESPLQTHLGKWDKQLAVVKYSKTVNMETFNSCILVDDEDNELAEPEMAIEFSACEDNADGHKLLGVPFFGDVTEQNPDCESLLQIDEDDDLGIRFYDSGIFNFMIKGSDLGFGNWKRAFGYLHSL